MRRLVVQILTAMLVIPGVVATQSPQPSTAPGEMPGGSPAASLDASVCQADVKMDVLPEWARGGFTDPEPNPLHTNGRSGEIVAILFGYPLTYPPRPDTNNKILWVVKDMTSASDLAISAQLMDGAAPIGVPVVRTVVGGPGPSIIDLPAVGCWRLTLDWGDQTDSLDLEYIGPTG